MIAPHSGMALVPCGHDRFCDSCAKCEHLVWYVKQLPSAPSANWHGAAAVQLNIIRYRASFIRWREKATPYNSQPSRLQTRVTSTNQPPRLQFAAVTPTKQPSRLQFTTCFVDVTVANCRRDDCFVDVTAVNCRVWPFHATVHSACSVQRLNCTCADFITVW